MLATVSSYLFQLIILMDLAYSTRNMLGFFH